MQENQYGGRILNDKRRLWKYIIFGVLTLGIYDLIFMWEMIKELNIVCGNVENGDEDRSPNYLLVVLFTILTLGIYNYIWYYKQGNRMKRAGKAYGIEIDEKGSTYILWMIFGILLFGVGPLVAMYLFISNMNKLCRMYNAQTEQSSNGSRGQGEYGQQGGYQPNPGNSPWNSSNSANGGYIGDSGSHRGNGGYGSSDDSSATWQYNDPRQYGVVDDVLTQGNSSFGKVRCIGGIYTGAQLELQPGEELVIGRNSAICQLVLPQEDISRKHCTIKYSSAEGAYYVTDFSTFGVIMNDSQKLIKGAVTKCPVGTKLTLGKSNNVFILQ